MKYKYIRTSELEQFKTVSKHLEKYQLCTKKNENIFTETTEQLLTMLEIVKIIVQIFKTKTRISNCTTIMSNAAHNECTASESIQKKRKTKLTKFTLPTRLLRYLMPQIIMNIY